MNARITLDSTTINMKKVKIESMVAPSLRKKLKAKAKKQNTSVADLIRDWAQTYIKS